MRREEIACLPQTRPFRSFRMRLTNDSLIDIQHPEMAIVTPSAVYLGIPAADGTPSAVDDIEIVSLVRAMKIANVPAPAPPISN